MHHSGHLTTKFLIDPMKPPQSRDVDLIHLKHCLHNSLRLLGILVLQHFAQNGGNNLP